MFDVLIYQERIRFVAIFVAAAMLLGRNALAHEGESHAEPESVPVALSGSDRISVSGHGDTFEVVLKFTPFEPGMEVPLTAYVLDTATNEPIHGAKVSGALSTGAESRNESFAEVAAGPPGAYEATVKVTGDEKVSWLFDVAAGDKTDLVAVDGFKAGGIGQSTSAHAETGKTSAFIELTRTQAAVAAAALVTVIVVLARLARRWSMRSKESHS